MNQRSIYSKRDATYHTAMKRLHSEEVSKTNRNLIEKWITTLCTKSCGIYRIGKLLSQILRILKDNGKPELSELTINELETIIAKINLNSRWSEATKSDYRRILKQFYLWFERYDGRLDTGDKSTRLFYLYIRQDLKVAYKQKTISPSDIITENDLMLVINKGCENNRDRAFISCLHESGARIGELMGLKIKDVTSDCTKINVDGKTGKRCIDIKIITPTYLMNWLKDHPFKDNPDAPVWTAQSNRFANKPLNYIGGVKIVRRAFQRAGLKKQHNPHWFRHSRMSINAQFMTEPILCRFAGWSIGSDQVKTYVHMGSDQVEEVINKHYGISNEEEKPMQRTCFRCNTINHHSSDFCGKCGNSMSSKALIEKNEMENKANLILEAIMQKPEFLQQFLEYTKKVKQND